MNTVEDNRRDWLMQLIEQAGSIAALNVQLGRDRTDATLSQIKNRSTHAKTGKPRSMGPKLAREIEEKLRLPHGSMDNPTHKAEAPAESQLKVQEPTAQYTVMELRWPFRDISPAEWASIPVNTRMGLELQIRALLPSVSRQMQAA